MTRFATALLLAVAVTLTARSEDKKPVTVLEGEWKFTAVTKEGKVEEKLSVAKLTAAGDKLTVRFETRAELAEFTLDPNAKPASIDLQPLDKDGNPLKKGEKEMAVVKGIYKIEKDVLTMCFALDGGERPKGFKSEKGTILMVLEKVKK
jgi:uncharacterized protein (TIGR03067 family)